METKLHIVDRISRTAVVTCGSFFVAVTAGGLGYLLFGL
ncbi:membrane protein [Arthrobacter phage Qui]|jgi:hypothetical protein|uniref:Membrane protein n=1 Tax=Arthrobacter phage Qui TaxID=2603260 RepID=A0A5B8WLZ6_9CAUD|nr:membrane protein [Arthrobacter phage Qui]QED11632.1 membrane protein [Arthrobacter phage Qui]QOC56464.1 membrane protein [Arthrobacter phage Paella]